MSDLDAAQKLLRSVFGFSSFRDGQAEIIAAILAGRDVLAIMPTGSGKSLCYQLPALLRERHCFAIAERMGARSGSLSKSETACHAARISLGPLEATPSGAGPVASNTQSGVSMARAASRSCAAHAARM